MITESDIAAINRYSAKVKADASAIGLTLHYSSDPYSFVEFLGRQEATHGISSIHDPERSYITPDNFAWLRAEQEGRAAACHAIRVIATDNLVRDIITHRLFENLRVKTRFEDVGVYPEAIDEIKRLDIRGRVAIGGGLWVSPNWRGQNLSGLLRKVLRVINIPRLDWQHYVSTFRDTPNREAWAMADSWNTSVFKLSHGHYPPYEKRQDIIMSHVSQEETLEFLKAEMNKGQE